jgi:hypothetical protein
MNNTHGTTTSSRYSSELNKIINYIFLGNNLK